MRITAHTNVLVRALVQHDPEQAKAAVDLLEQAELIGIPVPVLCELVWVLRRVDGFSASDCATAIEALGCEQLATFDQGAARLLSAAGEPVLPL